MNDRSFSYRPVQPGDLKAFCGFASSEEELFYFFPKAHFPLTPAQLQASIDKRVDSIVMEHIGLLAGFANFYHWEEGGSCSIGNVVINPRLRGLGAGRYLMRVMIELAELKYQAREVKESCFNHNTSALLLYRSLGF